MPLRRSNERTTARLALRNDGVEGLPGCTKTELAYFGYREECICDEASALADDRTCRHDYECTKWLSGRTSLA